MPERPHIGMIRSSLQLSLEENLSTIRKIMNIPPNRDIILRTLNLGEIPACLVFMEGMAGRSVIDQFVLAPCMEHDFSPELPHSQMADYLIENVLTIDDAQKVSGFEELLQQMLMGKSILLVDGCAEAVALETRGYEFRAVGKTSNESVVYGPKEGFVENLRTNITLLRRIVRSEALVSDLFTVGTQLPTQVSVLYLQGAANERALALIKRRIRSLNVPVCPGTGYLQQLIEDVPSSLMPQMLETERPDRVASCLSDGQIAVMVDGSPFALIAPVSFWHLLHASDDSFMRWQYGTFVRLIRMVGLLLSLLTPGVYVALTLYHQHMIPLDLLTSIAETRATVPFPIVGEVLIMEASFFLLNEASTRVPSLLGPSVGLIGALILGQAAVSASIISPILIIVIALTGLGNYTIPNYGVGIGMQIARLVLLVAGSMLGIYGIILALGILLTALCGTTSFGEPYMAPVAPYQPHNGDIVIRAPIWRQTVRLYLSNPNTWIRKAPGRVRRWKNK